MKTALMFATALSMAFAPLAFADTYQLDPAHTSVLWQADHFGYSHPTGKFAGITGTLVLDEKTPEKSNVNVTIPISGLATGIDKFDTHLKSQDFFNAEKFATATFSSTSVTRTGPDTAKVVGTLTLLGIAKEVTLNVKLNKIGEHPMTKKKTAGFSATTVITRSDFGMIYGVPGVADAVNVTIEAEGSIQQ